MALQKQPLNIPFAQGLDTKTDPKQVPPGKFLNLVNSVFTKGGLLSKRNGYKKLATADSTTTLTTYNNGLVAIGNSVQAYSKTNASLVNSGTLYPLDVSVESIVRNATSQTTVDVAVSQNGIACAVWLDGNGSSYYQITDTANSQTLIPKVALRSTATMPRVFVLGKNFIVTYMATVSGAPHLQYVAIPISNPGSPLAPQDIAVSIASITQPYDGVVVNNSLFVSWNANDGGGAVRTAFLNSGLILSSSSAIAGQSADLISVCADTANVIIYVSFYKAGTNTIKVHGYSPILVTTLATTTVVSSITINELTSTAINNVLTVFYEVANTYTFAPNAKTDYLAKNTVTSAGSVGSPATILRGAGLGSKAIYFSDQSKSYMLATYGQTLQPTYFLIDSSGNILGKIAYQNGGGYAINQILPSMYIKDSSLLVGYLFKDLLAAVNKTQGVANIAGVYSQTGINLATFAFGSNVTTADIGLNLHISGGFLWMYDGVKPVEHGFFVYPEDLAAIGSTTAGSMIAQTYFYKAVYEWTDNQGNIHRSAPSVPLTFVINTAPANFTGNRTSGSPVIASVSSTANLQVGQAVSGTGIPASTFILSIDSSTQITLTNNATSGTATATTITPTSLNSLTINVATLRQTYKTSNLVRIVLYRWSTAQQNYYRVTSITSPTLNSTTVDSIAFSDIQSDAQILGNDLIYTTGGVLENISPPACNSLALFGNRLCFIYGEDRNLIGYSKQVIEGVPVEFSDLLTMFVPPTTGAQGSTGICQVLCPMDDKLIISKKDAFYYVTGRGPDNTGANNDFSDPVFITSTVGSLNFNSFVFTPQGLMFQSDKGIWLLARNLQTSYIGSPVEAFNDQVVTSAVSIPATNQIRFTLDDRATLLYDYYYDQWGSFWNLPAISSTIYESLHTYLDQFGQIFQETPSLYKDGSTPVLMSFETAWMNLAGLQGFERAYFFYLIGEALSPHKLSVKMALDYNPSAVQAVLITPINGFETYGDDPLYGSSVYGGPVSLEQWRIFFEIQKCQAFKIYITEQFDSSFGTEPGAGLTLSGLNLIVGVKDGKPKLPAVQSIG